MADAENEADTSPEEVETPKTIFIKGEGGTIFEVDLPLHEAIRDRMAMGYIQRVANAEGDPFTEEVAAEDEGEVPTLPTERPALKALKPEWVAWAVAQGMAPDDAQALSKEDLIDKFGTNPANAVKPVQPGVPDPTA